MKKKKECVLVMCAHNDDHLLGCGGTLVNYKKSGVETIVVVFSYGESSHIWLKEDETIKMRVKESRNADKILGVNKTYYYGLKEGAFEEEIENKNLMKKIKSTIKVLKPNTIFTHSFDDFHPDHRAVYRTVMKALDETKYECDTYSFDIWNPFNIRKRDSPKMVVDITDSFSTKMRAFNLHRSQWMAKMIMTPASYIRALLNGLERGMKYAEVFYKLR